MHGDVEPSAILKSVRAHHVFISRSCSAWTTDSLKPAPLPRRIIPYIRNAVQPPRQQFHCLVPNLPLCTGARSCPKSNNLSKTATVTTSRCSSTTLSFGHLAEPTWLLSQAMRRPVRYSRSYHAMTSQRCTLPPSSTVKHDRNSASRHRRI